MAKKFLTGLQLANLASDPLSGVEGELYFNTTSDKIRIYINDAWTDLSASIEGQLFDIDSIEYPDYITFDTSPEIIPTAPGSLYWNTADRTLDLIINNDVTLQIGREEQYPPVINKSGVNIAKGDLVMVTGVQGDQLTVAKAVTDGSVNPDYIIGFATNSIPDDYALGSVIKFGYVGGIDTNAYAVGTILYADPANPGKLTNVKPDAPAYRVPIAIVAKKGNASSSRTLVRMSPASALGETDSNVKFENLQEGDLIVYDADNNLWVNTDKINGDLSVTGNLYVSGSAFYENTSDLTVEDPLIYLAANASGIYLSDLFDTGFVSAYGPHPEGGSAHYHRGLVYDNSAEKWKLASNFDHPIDNYINFDSASVQYDTLVAGTFEGNLEGIAASANYVDYSNVAGLEENYLTLSGASAILNQDLTIEYTITDNTVNTVDFWDASLYTTVEYNIQIVQGNKYHTQKLLTLNNNSNLVFNSYSIINIGESISGLSITSDINGGNGRLLIQITDASSNNAQVTVLRRTIS